MIYISIGLNVLFLVMIIAFMRRALIVQEFIKALRLISPPTVKEVIEEIDKSIDENDYNKIERITNKIKNLFFR